MIKWKKIANYKQAFKGLSKLVQESDDEALVEIAKELDEVDEVLNKKRLENEKKIEQQKETLEKFIRLTNEVNENSKELKKDLLQTIHAINPYINEPTKKMSASYGRLLMKVEPSYNKLLSNYLHDSEIEQMKNHLKTR